MFWKMLLNRREDFYGSLPSFAMVAWCCYAFAASPACGEPRNEIETAYSHTYKAAALKYRLGMHGHRSADFKAFDADGLEIDPKAEQAWLSLLLQQALTVKESGAIVRFVQLTDAAAECEVLDTIEATTVPDARKQTKSRVVIKTRSVDKWRRTDKGWKQISCRVIDQSYQTVPLTP